MADRKPRNSFLKLLSEPGFDFTPYFDKAVIEWLERNMDSFLKEAPQACKYFTKDPDYMQTVAPYIPIDDEKVLVDFMRAFDDSESSWSASTALSYLIPRLVEAGKADLVLNCVKTLNYHHTYRADAIKALSSKAVNELVDVIDLKHSRMDTPARCALIRKLSDDKLYKIDPLTWEWIDAKDRSQAISVLASRWPLNDIANFLSKFGQRYTALSCMSCGEKTAKSKPGYTLHRKSCDVADEFPNIWTIVARRTN